MDRTELPRRLLDLTLLRIATEDLGANIRGLLTVRIQDVRIGQVASWAEESRSQAAATQHMLDALPFFFLIPRAKVG